MAAGTLSFVPSSSRTKEAHIASVPVSLSCPHHINPSIKLPNPSPALAHAWTKALTQGGTTGIHYPVIHYSVLSWAHFSACIAEAQEHQHSTRKDFQTETREHPSPHSSGAETWPLGYYPQGAGCRLGHPVQQHSTSFTPTPSHLCQPFVPFLLQGQFGMPSPFCLVQAAMMSCQQWFQSYSLRTSGAGSVKFNCNIKKKHKIEQFVFYRLNFSPTSKCFNFVFNTLNKKAAEV